LKAVSLQAVLFQRLRTAPIPAFSASPRALQCHAASLVPIGLFNDCVKLPAATSPIWAHLSCFPLRFDFFGQFPPLGHKNCSDVRGATIRAGSGRNSFDRLLYPIQSGTVCVDCSWKCLVTIRNDVSPARNNPNDRRPAPAPRVPDCKPDFSGIWHTPRQQPGATFILFHSDSFCLNFPQFSHVRRALATRDYVPRPRVGQASACPDRVPQRSPQPRSWPHRRS
jgi:hypothetical protein